MNRGRKALPGYSLFARAPREARIGSVCEETSCPNRAECYEAGTAALVLLGKACTRACSFCFLSKGAPPPLDASEPERAAEAVARLRLRYVVLTSVDRDDLPDGGAEHFAAAIRAVRRRSPGTTVEALVPDFGGDRRAIHRVLEEAPDVLAHAVETIPRLYPEIRPGCDYPTSLEVLRRAHEWPERMPSKSAFSIGLGETTDEVVATIADLASVGCNFVTIGQYAPPTPKHRPASRLASPEEFESWKRMGESFGIRRVVAGPNARTTYRAAEMLASVPSP